MTTSLRVSFIHHLTFFFINGNMCQTSEKEETLQRNKKKKKQFNLSAQDQDFSTSSAVQLLKVTWIFHHSSHICWGQVMPKNHEQLKLRTSVGVLHYVHSLPQETLKILARLSLKDYHPFPVLSCEAISFFFGAMTQSS